jgi:hypothetical protein
MRKLLEKNLTSLFRTEVAVHFALEGSHYLQQHEHFLLLNLFTRTTRLTIEKRRLQH